MADDVEDSKKVTSGSREIEIQRTAANNIKFLYNGDLLQTKRCDETITARAVFDFIDSDTLPEILSKKWDFDLTTISDGSRKPFEELLERHNLTDYFRVEKEIYDGTSYSYAWTNPERDLVITTHNNPISGEYHNPERQREKEIGYAGYVAIEAVDPVDAALLAQDLRETARNVKAGGPEAGYSAVTDEIKEEIGFKGHNGEDDSEEQQADVEEGYERVEFTSSCPEFMGTDLETYGPYEEGDTAEVPEDNAEILVNRGNAEWVE